MSRLSRMQVGFGALVLAASVVSLAPTPAWSQPAPAGDWTPPQTPWGDPDIGGVWNSSTVTPAPTSRGARRQGVPDRGGSGGHRAARRRRQRPRQRAPASCAASRCRWAATSAATTPSGWIAGPPVVPTRRTSLVIDPPNGRLPALTPEHEAHVTFAGAAAPEGHPGRVGAGRLARAVRLRRPLHLVSRRPVAAHRLQQQLPHRADAPTSSPSCREHIHDVRFFIHLDGRPAIDEDISQFGGHSRGRWEGDTLVVETTNFGHRAYLFSSGPGVQGGINWDLSPALRVVERFTRVGPETLDYQFTLDDPNVWTRPWTGLVAVGTQRPADVRIRLPTRATTG